MKGVTPRKKAYPVCSTKIHPLKGVLGQYPQALAQSAHTFNCWWLHLEQGEHPLLSR